MKKLLLCLVLLLSGCKNGYTLIRNPESDVIKLGLVVSETDKHLIEGLDIDVQFTYVCNMDCLKRFNDLEKEYVDGIVLVGEEVIQSFENFENKNNIPTITAYKQNQFFALKKLFPELKNWEHVSSNEISDEEVDAYYIEEGITIEIEKPFYQLNNSKSMCTLIEDKIKFQQDLNKRIDYFINTSNNDSTLFIEWIKNKAL